MGLVCLMGKNYVHIFRDLLGKIENPGKTLI